MKSDFSLLTFVVPTRNRSDLARNAINSIRFQGVDGIRIFVSDNSTDESESKQLEQFCAGLGDDRVSYHRPPQSLSMTKHYDWAFSQVLAQQDTDHFALLTDRMIFKAGRLPELIQIARSHPDKIVAYDHDRLADHHLPVILEQQPWTGEVFELDAARLLRLSSQCVFGGYLPRMMNCIVPRHVFEAIRQRYGNLFDSIAPDFNFCYRSLNLFDSIIYQNNFPLLHYALSRSNGESQTRGIASKDHLDFIANLEGKTFNYAAPIPEFLTVGNAIIHEYCFVQQETSSPKFPPMDRARYLDFIAGELPGIANPELRGKIAEQLESHGWSPAKRRAWSERLANAGFSGLLSKPGALIRRYWSMFVSLPALRPVWKWLARTFRFYPAVPLMQFEFNTQEEAFDFAGRFPRPRRPNKLLTAFFKE